MLRTGIVGLPNVGKSTLFNALTSSKNAQSANYPFCTIEPNVGVVEVPDERLPKLAKLCKTDVIIPTAIEFVDIAGLVKGASKGEGLGNQFLHNIREVDAIIQVVRCFDDENTIHVEGKVDPISDIETINTELALADLASIERRQQRISKQAKGGDKNAVLEDKVLDRLTELLSEGTFINVREHLNDDEISVVKMLNLMSTKPVIYVANVSEYDLKDGILTFRANEFIGKGISYCATCDGFFFKNKPVCVIAENTNALQESLYLANLVSKVTMITKRDNLLGDQVIIDSILNNPKIELITNVYPTRLIIKDDKLVGLHIKDSDNVEREIECFGIFPYISFNPSTDFLDSTILNEKGFIVCFGFFFYLIKFHLHNSNIL